MKLVALAVALLLACGGDDDAPPGLTFTVVTFNSGTGPDAPHNSPPDDGYDSDDADISDMYYGDGLAWVDAVDATREFLAGVQPDVIGFQEIFYSGECATIPVDEAHDKFVCATWTAGDLTVAQVVLGAGYQVACHLGKSDKCMAVRRAFGTIRGCGDDFCLEGLDGAQVDGCSRGSRIGRATIDLVDGGTITVVNVHGSSGLTQDDADCRVRQFEQVFVDLDGEPAANGAANVVLGDLNTDPGRFAGQEDSATRFTDFVGEDKPFHFISDVGPDALPSYQDVLNIDHVVSDVFDGECWVAGVTEGHPVVIEAVYFDHKPVVCTVEGDPPGAK